MRGGRTMWLPPPPCRLGLWGLRSAGHWPPRTAAPGLCDAALPFQMWKASAGHTVSIAQDDGGADDWETDPDFVVRDSSRPACASPRAAFPRLLLGRGAGGWSVLQGELVCCSFQNDVSEKEQRWGAKTVQGSGHQEHIK